MWQTCRVTSPSNCSMLITDRWWKKTGLSAEVWNHHIMYTKFSCLIYNKMWSSQMGEILVWAWGSMGQGGLTFNFFSHSSSSAVFVRLASVSSTACAFLLFPFPAFFNFTVPSLLFNKSLSSFFKIVNPENDSAVTEESTSKDSRFSRKQSIWCHQGIATPAGALDSASGSLTLARRTSPYE